MKTSEKHCDHVDRRSVLRGLGVTAGALSLSGCGLHPSDGISSGPPPGGSVPLAVDAHCHVFNGRDLPIYGYLDKVAIQNPVLQVIAAPLVLMITDSVVGQAKTYAEELDALQHISSGSLATAQYAQNADAFAKFVSFTINRFVENRTSFGGRVSRGSPRAEENDRFVLYLYRRFGLFPQEIDRTQTRRFMTSKQQDLTSQIIKPMDISLDIAYVQQFFRWAYELTRFRFQITDDLAERFGDPDTKLRFLAPAIIDLHYWMADPNFDREPTSVLQQAKLMQLISLTQPAGRMMHGFIAFDPWRYLDDLFRGRSPNALEVVKTAVETYGFIGIKLYPAMGFKPIDNAGKSDNEFPVGLQQLGPNVGAKLDQALAQLYWYCAQNDVPIMAHCADTNGAMHEYSVRASPDFWVPVLEQHKNLRLNLGHFGGIWGFYGGEAAVCTEHPTSGEHWTCAIADMLAKFPNLYADFGDFAQVLDRTTEEGSEERQVFANLKKLAERDPLLTSRMMYGSDWVALDYEPGNQNYYSMMRQKFADTFGTEKMVALLGGNAANFLGLGTGQATRQRLTAFYRDNGRPVPDFDAVPSV